MYITTKIKCASCCHLQSHYTVEISSVLPLHFKPLSLTYTLYRCTRENHHTAHLNCLSLYRDKRKTYNLGLLSQNDNIVAMTSQTWQLFPHFFHSCYFFSSAFPNNDNTTYPQISAFAFQLILGEEQSRHQPERIQPVRLDTPTSGNIILFSITASSPISLSFYLSLSNASFKLNFGSLSLFQSRISFWV